MNQFKNQFEIKHYTKRLPGIVRNEVYEFKDIKYTESFDDLTGERMYGTISMYNDTTVCHVNQNGSIGLDMPMGLVTNHNDMTNLISDLERLDKFLAAVCKNYH
jgi:hypothetical protein